MDAVVWRPSLALHYGLCSTWSCPHSLLTWAVRVSPSPHITARCFILSVCAGKDRASRSLKETLPVQSWGGGYFLSVETPAVSWPLNLPHGGRKAYSIQEDTCFWMAKPHRSGVYDRYKSRLSEQQISDLFRGSQIQRMWTLQLSTSLLQTLVGTWSVRSVDRLTMFLHCPHLLYPVFPSWAIRTSCRLQRANPAAIQTGGFPEKTGWRHFAGVWPKVLLWSFHSILPSLSQLLPDVFVGKGTFTWRAYAWLSPGQLFWALELLPLIEPKDTYCLIPGRGRGFPCGLGLHDVGDNFSHCSIYWALTAFATSKADCISVLFLQHLRMSWIRGLFPKGII